MSSKETEGSVGTEQWNLNVDTKPKQVFSFTQ